LLEPAMTALRRELGREGAGKPTDAMVVTYAMFPAETLALVRGDAVAERLDDEAVADGDLHAGAVDGVPEPAGSDEPAATTPGDSAPRSVRELTVEVDGQTYAVRVFSMPEAGGATAEQSTPSGSPPVIREGTVVAPMQGLLLKVPVKVGDNVHIGDVVAVLEAMKMQNDIPATRSGVVTDVYVKEGDVVRPRDALVHIEDR
jgi:pyruvate carboxylase subunit B